jgi:hypothetical protein
MNTLEEGIKILEDLPIGTYKCYDKNNELFIFMKVKSPHDNDESLDIYAIGSDEPYTAKEILKFNIINSNSEFHKYFNIELIK